jgi:Domain of unknown function (DUF5679)
MSASYCIKCKARTEDVDPKAHEISTSRGPRYQLKSGCKECGRTKCKFISAQEARGHGLITDLIKKFAPNTAPTIDRVQGAMGAIPLVGPILGSLI